MGFFELFFGTNDDRNRKAREQEMANMYEYGWDSQNSKIFVVIMFLDFFFYNFPFKFIIHTH